MNKLIKSCILIIIPFAAGCKKSPHTSQIETGTIEPGIYEGKLNDWRGANGSTDINKFRVEISKVDENTYRVQEIDKQNVPGFKMVVKSVSVHILLAIPKQTFEGKSFSGTGAVSNGFDVLYVPSQKSIFFGISFDDAPQKHINFSGYKQ